MSTTEKNFFLRKIKLIISVFMLMTFAILFLVSSSGAYEKTKEGKTYLPIIMYHSLLKDSELHNDYVISPQVFETDLKYFKEYGYTTVTVNDLVDYVYNDKELPAKSVMLTFDDGYYNNYEYAYPLLKEYESKAVISPIAKMSEAFTDTGEVSVTYGHIDVDRMKEMIESGYVEIQNHSYDMHNLSPRKGIEQKSGESDEVYKKILTEDIQKSQNFLKDKVGVNPVCYVYPFGAESSNSLDIIKESGFLCTLTCVEKPNFITRNPESLYELGRYRRDGSESIESLMAKISRDAGR